MSSSAKSAVAVAGRNCTIWRGFAAVAPTERSTSVTSPGLRADQLYTDFFELLPPGGFLITEGWLRAFGASLLSARLLAVVTIAGIASLTYLTCLRVSKNVVGSALVVFAWVVTSQGVWTQINHHWFTTLLSIAAFYTSLVHAQTTRQKCETRSWGSGSRRSK